MLKSWFPDRKQSTLNKVYKFFKYQTKIMHESCMLYAICMFKFEPLFILLTICGLEKLQNKLKFVLICLFLDKEIYKEIRKRPNYDIYTLMTECN